MPKQQSREKTTFLWGHVKQLGFIVDSATSQLCDSGKLFHLPEPVSSLV